MSLRLLPHSGTQSGMYSVRKPVWVGTRETGAREDVAHPLVPSAPEKTGADNLRVDQL